MIAKLLVGFYGFWHGKLGLKGAGGLLRRCLGVVPELKRYPVRLPEGQEIHLDFGDVTGFVWLNHLLGDRFQEEGLLIAMREFLDDEAVVWDIGANCGLLSYLLARDGGQAAIEFFEPNPSVFAIACAATSPFESVRGHNLALSDSSGRVVMDLSVGGSTTGSIVESSDNGFLTEVASARGDEILAAGKAMPPRVIKIDTEGHEPAVLRGITDLVSEHRPVIFFEHLDLSVEEVNELVPDGYQLFSVSDSDGSLAGGFDRTRGHNSALVPDSLAVDRS